MCGFAGVVTWDEKYRVTRDTLEEMSRAIAHRGPDGEGFHLTRENEPITPDTPQVGLAFRRLAILDPDPRSNQPFHIGPLTLVFNGEIYNFRELKSEISKLRPDYRWRTTGDTEVLLMAYDVWREKCVEKLNGMFAFAVWDEQKKRLFWARDRMGQKPLYWFPIPSTSYKMIAFASELPALMQLPWAERKMEFGGFYDYLRFGYFPAAFTPYQGIYNFGKGQRGGWPDKSDESTLYHDPLAQFRESKGTPRTVDEARRLVLQAVGRQLVSDVPLGCFLSGGIDSSVIALAMKNTLLDASSVLTFSIGFEDPRYDERPFAAAVAKHLGTTHHEFIVRPNAVSDLTQLSQIFGEPFGDSSTIPTHYLSRETRRSVKVALSGDGGDELFGGYDRYRAMAIGRRLQRLPYPIRRMLRACLRMLPGTHPKSRGHRLKRLLATLEHNPWERYASFVSIFDDATIAELLLPDLQGIKPIDGMDWIELVHMEHQFCFRVGYDAVQASLATDRELYLPYDLLAKLDRASMLHGLEVRSPFMDHELVQFAAGLTTDQLLKGGPKRMLREAFAKDLPDFVFKRKKMGFAVPIGEWFRGELRAMLRDNLFASDSFGRSHFNMKVVERLVDEHEQNRVDHSQRLYALLMLELWWRGQRGMVA